MSSVRERTQKEIIDYIRTHSKDRRLTKSLLDIAKDIGYSNATIHRALHVLQKEGQIDIVASDKPTEPNTIIYKGSQNELDELLAEGAKLSKDMQDLNRRMGEFMQEATRTIRRLQERAENASVMDRVVSVQDIPDSDLQVLTVRKAEQ